MVLWHFNCFASTIEIINMLLGAVLIMSISAVCIILYCNYLSDCYHRDAKDAKSAAQLKLVAEDKAEEVEEAVLEEINQ